METIKKIQNSIENSVSRNSQASLNRLSNNNKQKVKDITQEESAYLVLILYILLILFVSVTLIIIVQGDKLNPYTDTKHRKFSGDISNKKALSVWDKLYYIIFGSHKVNNRYESRTEHLECSRTDYPACGINKGEHSTQSRLNSKYSYLESFYNIVSNISNNNLNNKFYKECNDSSYLGQFEESRKCLLNDNTSNSCSSSNVNNNSITDNNSCNGKYSYLDLELY
jgi:hypothetical protein